LANSVKSLDELIRSDKTVLLENALFDTEQPLRLDIPAELRAGPHPGAYIIQCRGPINAAFRKRLIEAGASIVSYIPNNALLIRVSDAGMNWLAADPQTQAVLPYEPLFKLKSPLLEVALDPNLGNAPAALTLNVLLFGPDTAKARGSIGPLAIEILGEENCPFGPILKLRCASSKLSALAHLAEVQEIELGHARAPANDLARAAVGVSGDSQTSSNYLGLSGSNVLVNLNDTGVDAGHLDLAGRIIGDVPAGLVDTNGHGTHVAGIIAGSGAQSTSVASAPGSPSPPVALQFRGKAPAARILSLAVNLDSGTPATDAYLQQTAARNDALISNNSWHYVGDNQYDLAAASYDAATRDALPAVSGGQPLLFVFAAGNSGAGTDNGGGGNPDSIESPATAKNVITVGANEQLRFITNQTWTCTTNAGQPVCQTNSPWLGLTDDSNQVASFSSRGNVGLGIEGALGRFKPDVVAPGTFVVSTRSGQWDQEAYFAQVGNAFIASPDANCLEVLSNLNQTVSPHYRFESGTSVAAGTVSGVLALMQEFFEQRLSQTNSPALMKALLINGARPLNTSYEFQSATNLQGWGLVHLPNSVPPTLTNANPAIGSMLLFDQNPALALATGQSQTRLICVSPAARHQPLRFTLVWTDPPANPVAGLKLVNDLDLIVTNMDTGDVFLGNDIPAGAQFNAPWISGLAQRRDCVNNVENIFLSPDLTAHYSVTVLGRRVNVNAVAAQTSDVVQDYALVISGGDGAVPDALTLTNSPVFAASRTAVTAVTNTFAAGTGLYGAVLPQERAGANSPIPFTNGVTLPSVPNGTLTIGSTNQWRFYVVANDPGFTNAAFLTFKPSMLSLPPPGLPGNSVAAFRSDPDLDLYVSRDPGLTNLDPVVLAAADASLGRGGTETIIYSNANAGPYYIAIKCESQMAAQFGLLAVFAQSPFATGDGLGNQLLSGFPAPAAIPGGTPTKPSTVEIFALAPDSVAVRRVLVTNTLSHPQVRELAAALSHGAGSVLLRNHSSNGAVTQQDFIYNDTAEADVPGSQATDGPGNLRGFAGRQAFGQWRFSISSTNQPGTNDGTSVYLEAQQDLAAGDAFSVLPGACREDVIYVPPEATNLTATLTFLSGTGPVSFQTCPAGSMSSDCLALEVDASVPNAVLVNDATTQPPLNPGHYFLRVCNSGPDAAMVSLSAVLGAAPGPPPPVRYTCTIPLSIADDAVSSSTIQVTNTAAVSSVEVGVRLDHPRVSDLVLSLISPDGTRVLLQENRGGFTTNGLGFNLLSTNITPVSSTGGPQASTNVINTGENSGTLAINYDFYSLPDDMRIYYEGNLLYDSGLVSGRGSVNLNYGPGASTVVTIVMNEGGNYDINTAWFYAVATTRLDSIFVTFTENTNLASLPIKFASPPFNQFNYSSPGSNPSNGIFYLPEESLDKFIRRSALGSWTLELWDSRAGAGNPAPILISWQLDFRLRQELPVPLPLIHDLPATNYIGPGQLQWFAVDVPDWVSFVTNTLVSASAPVNLLFNQVSSPTGTNAGDVGLLYGVIAGGRVLSTNISPQLQPGARYYLALQNTNQFLVQSVFQVGFDLPVVPSLDNASPFTTTASPGGTDYYLFVVGNDAARAQFEINSPSGDMTLLVRRGPPLPSLSSYDYFSANPGTNDELIVVYDFSRPVPLGPGEWFLAAVNLTSSPVTYSISASQFNIYGTNISLSAPQIMGDAFCFTWNSLPGVHYYVQAKMTLTDGDWATLAPPVTASDFSTSFCVPLPSPYSFFRVHEGLVIMPLTVSLSCPGCPYTGALLRWNAPANSQFKVQWTPSLQSPGWFDFPGIVTSTSNQFSFLDESPAALAALRFYRILQVQ
jgi:subtilisin family serine protease